jgi:hypothetical protein
VNKAKIDTIHRLAHRVLALRRERDVRELDYTNALAEFHAVLTPEVVGELIAERDVLERRITELSGRISPLGGES